MALNLFSRKQKVVVQNPDILIKKFSDSPKTAIDELKKIEFKLIADVLVNYDSKTIAHIVKEFSINDIESILGRLTADKRAAVINSLPSTLTADLIQSNLHHVMV